MKIPDLPYWAESAYMVGHGVYRRVENEQMETDDEKTDFSIQGKGDSDAFAAINAHLNQLRGK